MDLGQHGLDPHVRLPVPQDGPLASHAERLDQGEQARVNLAPVRVTRVEEERLTRLRPRAPALFESEEEPVRRPDPELGLEVDEHVVLRAPPAHVDERVGDPVEEALLCEVPQEDALVLCPCRVQGPIGLDLVERPPKHGPVGGRGPGGVVSPRRLDDPTDDVRVQAEAFQDPPVAGAARRLPDESVPDLGRAGRARDGPVPRPPAPVEVPEVDLDAEWPREPLGDAVEDLAVAGDEVEPAEPVGLGPSEEPQHVGHENGGRHAGRHVGDRVGGPARGPTVGEARQTGRPGHRAGEPVRRVAVSVEDPLVSVRVARVQEDPLGPGSPGALDVGGRAVPVVPDGVDGHALGLSPRGRTGVRSAWCGRGCSRRRGRRRAPKIRGAGAGPR